MHLFNKASITIVVGCILPFDYNGDMYLPILLNSVNHMLIYLHYLLASLGYRSRWSSYITSFQLSQFILIFFQSLLSYRIGPTCGSPDFAKVLMIIYMGNMIALFINFVLQVHIPIYYPRTDLNNFPLYIEIYLWITLRRLGSMWCCKNTSNDHEYQRPVLRYRSPR